MIFGSVIRRAESAVENILEQALARVAVAIPLLIAGGFATAAASTHLVSVYGAATGHLIMAAGFAVLGLIVAAFVAFRAPPTAASEGETLASSEATPAVGDEQAADALPFSDSERELITSALASAVPIAVPGLMRTLLRNIPLVLLFLIVAFVFMRKEPAPAGAAASPAV